MVEMPKANQNAAFGTPKGLQSRYIVRGEGAPNWLDAVVAMGVGGAGVGWIASQNRASGADIGWAAFFAGLGSVAAVEGTGELRLGGLALAGASAGYGVLRVMGVVNVP